MSMPAIKMVRHGRCVVLQMAEIAMSRAVIT